MKLFVDSSDIDEIKEAVSWGVVDGVTTNPRWVSGSAAGPASCFGPDSLKFHRISAACSHVSFKQSGRLHTVVQWFAEGGMCLSTHGRGAAHADHAVMCCAGVCCMPAAHMVACVSAW
jgi:hypothetical protein